jgi:hypothetical protein
VYEREGDGSLNPIALGYMVDGFGIDAPDPIETSVAHE